MRPALAENVVRTSDRLKLPAGRPSWRRVSLAWLLVLIWAGIIWQFGSDAYSLDRTSRLLQPLIDWLLAGVDLATRLRIHAWIRKSAHFIEYAILALLAFRAALLSAESQRIGTAFWVALFFVATVAAADEFRQSLSTARTGSPYDVLIDVAGGLIGLLGVLVITRRMRTSKLVRRLF
jgi:VanZ family protein